jgi:GNAT superfamily N-acetyltransferase
MTHDTHQDGSADDTEPHDVVGLAAATQRMVERIGRALTDGALDPLGALAMRPLHLRPVLDTDAAALSSLIGAAYDEFDCGPLDPDGFDADLALPASRALERRRRWWVIESPVPPAGVRVVASVAHGRLHTTSPDVRAASIETATAGAVELHRLYLDPSVRGTGLGHVLLEGVADEARRLGAGHLVAWSDTRLVRAHARYLAAGFRLAARTRRLDDPAGSVEACFVLDL